MTCPRCRNDVELAPRNDRRSGVALDVCRQCGGIWFDALELDRVLDVAAKDLRPPGAGDQPPTALCPKCHVPMTAFHYPQTLATVDMCRDCHGVWLDGRELEEIAAVRRALRRRNALDEYAPVRGIKGTLVRFINSAISFLAAD